ncbi:MAG: hypothetical protein J1F63_00570 [Oscillospiraceae bacterium]|nr:hypothetical protein [Oscillospiraceae bacterium]
MKKTFKTALVLFALLLCFASLAHAEGIGFQWNTQVLTEGELSVKLTGVEDGLRAVLALYEGDMLVGLGTKTIENSAAELSVTVKNAENGSAKLMLWSWDNITPMSAVVSMITPEGITPELPKVGELKVSAWVDADGDGSFGENDKKLPGAAIKLVQGETAIEAETDENGEYTFEELPEGEYTVEVTDPSGRESIGDNPLSVTVADGGKAEAAFGFKLLPGSISGTVWNDADRNSVKDEGEEPMPGVKVTLGEDTAVTGEDGTYKFENLIPTDYTVTVETPEDYIITTGNESLEVSVHEGEAVENNVGLAINVGTISGVVYSDANRNGVKDEGEELMAGVAVTLGETELKTDENGAYKFEKLAPGSYTVAVAVPEDYICTTGNESKEITVIAGEAAENNVGFAINIGSISGVVWIDANRNQAKDDEEEVCAGAVVTLSTGESVTTDENGAYSFAGLRPGTYSVSTPVPENYELTTDNTEALVLPGEETVTGIGFALKRGSVSGLVWLDKNDNGVMDEGEGLEGVSLSRDGDMSAGMPEAVTDENGVYSFVGLEPGEYTLTIALPVNTLTETESVTVTVAPGGEAEADFMLTKATDPGSIEGIVWNDNNSNGIRDDDESGVTYTAVTLTAVDGSYSTSTRTGFWGDYSGTYSFNNLTPGDYIIEVSTSGSRKAQANPRTVTVISGSTITVDFGLYQPWVSDNQLSGNSASVGYHEIDPAIAGEYTVSFELTIVREGDNAVLLGDSANGTLAYNTSSAILLFPNNGYFGVRTGNGNGGYTDTTQTNLCEAKAGETYAVTISGNITENTYRVSVTGADGIAYTSGTMRARTNGAKIDTIALISNSHNTTVRNGNYSNYYFYIDNFSAAGGAVIPGEPEVPVDPSEVEYKGFAGLYYGITVNDKYIRGNSGRISADYNSVRDTSAQFLPRDMADGTFALLCRSSNRRITTADQGSQLPSGDYAYNDLTQHWYLEESENYSPEHLSYYMRSADNDVYIGLSGSYLAAVAEANKVELVFNPLYDESPLYLASRTSAYAMLTEAQRKRIETIYETVAGDVFDRYSNNIVGAEWTARKRLDNIFNTKILPGDLSVTAQYNSLNNFFNTTDGYLVTNTDLYPPSANLPETEGVTCATDDGVYGSYDFWRGTMLNGTRYTLRIYNKDGSLQQSMDLYVEDHNDARTNAENFKKAVVQIPYSYRRYIRSVKIRVDTANSFNCGTSDLYIRVQGTRDVNTIKNLISHEFSHSVDMSNGNWSHGGGWANAMANDMIMVSQYANTSKYEDFAEFGRLYFVCYNNRDRQKALQLLFPERYASYWRLRHQRLDGFELWEDTEYLNY